MTLNGPQVYIVIIIITKVIITVMILLTSASALSGPGLASGRCAGLEGVEDDLGEAGAHQHRHQETLQ